MQAVILAGGLGLRLRPITELIPKPLINVNGKPFLEWQISFLKRYGFTDIVLLTGYLSEQIEKFLGNGSRFGVRIRYSRESTPLGTGGAIVQALQYLEDTFLLTYGDSFLPIDCAMVYNQLLQSKDLGLMVLYQDKFAETAVRPNIWLDEESDYIRGYCKTGGGPFQYIDAGVSIFRKDAFRDRDDTAQVSLESGFLAKLISEHKLRGYISPHRFYDIGTFAGLEEMERFSTSFD